MSDARRAARRGEVIDRDPAAYDEARRVWNGLIDRHPAVIARCADVADVVETLRVARHHRPVTTIRGGGHQVAGSAAPTGVGHTISGVTAAVRGVADPVPRGMTA